MLVGVAANPWPGRVVLQAGGDLETLSERVVFDAPCGVGMLRDSLPAGPLGRWDEGAQVTLWMPDEDLSSAIDSAVLSGANKLLIERADGWELLAWRQAVLIDEDSWQLKGLLRGLSGTQTGVASAGARVLLVDDRLQFVDMNKDEIGLSLSWKAGDADAVSFTHEDKNGLSWCVGHLKVEASGTDWAVSWTRRGADIADNWNLPEAVNSGTFRVETYLGEALVESLVVHEARVSVSSIGIDRIRVAEVASDNRVGEWASIPLFAA